MSKKISTGPIQQLQAAVGPEGWSCDAEELAPLLLDQRGNFQGATPILLRPACTEEVAKVLSICHQAHIAVVPQGGNTSLVGGSVPDEAGDQILLSLSRMDRIRALSTADFTLTAEAGCILATLQDAAEAENLLFPLSLAAEGSCQIGGNLSTNAGGTAVLRYGNARDLVLGLEVVFANGEIWHGLRALRKDNAGYDLKQLFLGSEGTLGIITAAVLKLFPRPNHTETALVVVPDAEAAMALLQACRAEVGEAVTRFEYMDRSSMELVLRQMPDIRNPFAEVHDHYVLLDLASSHGGEALAHSLETLLQERLEQGQVLDAVIAQSGRQAKDLWRIREGIPEAQRKDGAGLKQDVSVPLSRLPEFLQRARQLVSEAFPEALIVAFGHLGDGNLHFNLNQPQGMDAESFRARGPEIHRLVYDLAVEMEGSFAAEHGVGRLKREELRRYRPAVEVELMAKLKQTLDPRGILNPGKVV